MHSLHVLSKMGNTIWLPWVAMLPSSREPQCDLREEELTMHIYQPMHLLWIQLLGKPSIYNYIFQLIQSDLAKTSATR